MKCSYLFLIVWVSCLIAGCRKNWTEIDAKKNADYIMTHIHDDTVTTFFPKQYFPPDQISLLLENLRSKCSFSTRKGGYKDSYYTFNIGQPDQVTFTYEYMYDCSGLRFQLTYYIYWRSYELKSLYLTDLTEARGR